MRYQITTLVVFVLFFVACKKAAKNETIVTPTTDKTYYTTSQFVMGADLSYVNQIQDYGGTYKDSGQIKDPFLIFKQHGTNTVRVRLWHNPNWLAPLNSGSLYSNLADVEKTIQRAKTAGMSVCLDIHYSDEWADPANQKMPVAWSSSLNLADLKDSVYNYTTQVLHQLKAKNLTPEFIQIGNETNQGMLFNTGKVVSNNWIPFGELLKSGIKAVRDFSITSTIKPQIIVHVAKLTDADYFANGVINLGGVTDFDILGISHYYIWSTLTSMNDIANVIRNAKNKYGKKIMIVETAYPWTNAGADSYNNIISGSTIFPGYAVSKEGQFMYLKDLTQTIISAGGSGVMYWEPAWISSGLSDKWGTGSSWENNTFFDFNGNVLPGIDFMTHKYSF